MSTYRCELKSLLGDQNTLMKCDQMNFIQHSLKGNTLTSAGGV